MKKILTFFAVVAFVSVAQAATLNWMISQVQAPGTTSNASGYATYLFITQQSGNFGAGTTTVADVISFIKGGATEVTDTAGKVTSLVLGNDTIDVAASKTTSNGMITGGTGYNGGNYVAGDSLSAFAVILDGANIGAAQNYIVTSVESVTWAGSTGAQQLKFGSQAPVNGQERWTPVPEPSTAALALAGLALLLKRRRA